MCAFKSGSILNIYQLFCGWPQEMLETMYDNGPADQLDWVGFYSYTSALDSESSISLCRSHSVLEVNQLRTVRIQHDDDDHVFNHYCEILNSGHNFRATWIIYPAIRTAKAPCIRQLLHILWVRLRWVSWVHKICFVIYFASPTDIAHVLLKSELCVCAWLAYVWVYLLFVGVLVCLRVHSISMHLPDKVNANNIRSSRRFCSMLHPASKPALCCVPTCYHTKWLNRS